MSALRQARLSGILLGVGLGGFVDGIVLHQILQWHNMLSSRLPPTTLAAMRTNMWADGLFHTATWIFTAIGVGLLYRCARARQPLPPFRWYLGQYFIGWGAFNLVEGVIDHHLLAIHHVRGYPSAVWDYGFLLVGGLGLMALGGWMGRGGESAMIEASGSPAGR